MATGTFIVITFEPEMDDLCQMSCFIKPDGPNAVIPLILRHYVGTGTRLNFPLNLDQSLYDSTIKALKEALGPKCDAAVLESAMDLFSEADGYLVGILECSVGCDDNRNADTMLERRIVGPCDVLYVQMCVKPDEDVFKVLADLVKDCSNRKLP